MRKSVKSEGKVREYVVYDLDGKTVGETRSDGCTYTTLTSDEIRESAQVMATEYVAIVGLLGQKR